jgi:hypothetical protein
MYVVVIMFTRTATAPQQEEQETDIPPQPPLMPPLIQDQQTTPQELLLPPSAYSPMSLPSMPLQQQGYRNQQLLGISTAGHASQPWSYDIAAQSSMP